MRSLSGRRPGWTGESFHKCLHSYLLTVIHAACEVFDPPPPLVRQVDPPRVKRGDVVLLKLLPEMSLNYKDAYLDPSFFPHGTFAGAEWEFPYRPAVVRKVKIFKSDANFFGLEVYPLVRRSDLHELSTRRSRSLRPLEALVESGTGTQVLCEQLLVYRPCLLFTFRIEYNQARLLHLDILPNS
jgi:hypothetical protein